MVTTNDVLNFALAHKVFIREELIAILRNLNQISSSSSPSEQLKHLLKSDQLIRLKRGIYTLPD